MKREIAMTLILTTIVGAASMTLAQLDSKVESTAQATTVPRIVKFAGTVKDDAGKPRTGIVGVTFALYKDQETGGALWIETQNVQLDAGGHYTVLLGSTKPDGLPTELFTSGEARWLGIQPEGQAEQPRVLLLSVPYALKAGDAETVGGLPASAFMRAAQRGDAAPAEVAATVPNVLPPAVRGNGTTNFLPIWTGKNLVANSMLVQVGGNLGIGNDAPATTLDVSGAATIRGNATITGTLSASSSFSAPSGGFSGSSSSPILNVTQAGTGIGLSATTAATSGANGAINGTATATTGLGRGVIGMAYSDNGTGVYGAAGAFGAGSSTGVYGVSISANGTGVSGSGSVGVLGSGFKVGGLFQIGATSGLILQGLNLNGATEFSVDNAGNTFTGGRVTTAGNGQYTMIGDPGCGGGYAGIGFGALSSCNNYSMIGNGTDTFINRPLNGWLHFRENNGEQMTIAAGGHVGIANGNPVEALDVGGRVRSQNLRLQAAASDLQFSTCASFCTVPGMVVGATTGNVPVLLMVNIGGISSGNCGQTTFGLFVDGTEVATSSVTLGVNNGGYYSQSPITLMSLQTPAPGFHTFSVQWLANYSGCSGFNAALSISNSGNTRSLIVLEM
ncbi:MAG TPA: hypothetical protein VFF58_01055 [Candidatus Nitrosotalea sp.]|nr:hypothetical protein [Candidatus Nitrosotalea sp.]